MNNKSWKTVANSKLAKRKSQTAKQAEVKVNTQYYEDYKKQVIEESENKQ